ncbi:HAMP domain-containing sensor histidine kinase [Actinoplanes sp. Pm04-4]|uniref:histidine kinase n=1 Tax=Paractinoplanes pyxinae TaxID=2997416 RepID=A0ABT4B604_9ACTN|nr:HAMP domain-containing sensor histidine kinase [Actinoplanes pyxinae]MCY1141295.1 HAMP domain-containing sensor histidine kinase [Actinoplanes pyxinae]
MPDRPDYSALTRGQIAILDRINSGEAGLPVLQHIVRLAQETLGGRGAGFAEYAPDHGRIIAATGVCRAAIGRRVERADGRLRDGRTLLIPLDSLNDEFAKQVEGGDVRHMLGARCEVGETIVGSLHVYFGAGDGEPGPDHHAVLELLAGQAGRLYAAREGLPVHTSADQARRQDGRDLWVAVTSHELRTPVTVIKGYADTLTNHWESLGDAGRQEAVNVIGTRAGELARLVDRLLSAATEDGEIGASPIGPFDLAEALRTAVDELPAELRRRVKLDNLPGEMPKAYGDRDSIATILTELATNAEKHSPAESVVELCAGVDEETLRFRLSDRGVGIRPEHVERAFERYWQAEGGDRRHHPGAGLGLYLVRRLVERQHGWVSLRPREGGGTTAEVRLPRA